MSVVSAEPGAAEARDEAGEAMGLAATDHLRPLPADLRLAVVCVGAQKCGTTWLHHQLGRRADVSSRSFKEFNYLWEPELPWFRDAPLPLSAELRRALRKVRSPRDLLDAGARVKARHYRNRLRYGPVEPYRRTVMTGRGAGEAVLDFSPDYALMSARGFARLDAAWQGRAHAVLMMRDPVERIWSMTKHYARNYRGQVDGDKALTLFERVVRNPADIGYARSRYDVTIRALEAVFPADRRSYLFYETMTAPEVLSRFGRRLGLEDLSAGAPEARVNASETDVAPPEALVAEARATLAPTYDFIRERFGDEAPSRWRW